MNDLREFGRSVREFNRVTREVGRAFRGAAEAGAEVTGIGGRYGARDAQIDAAEARARAAAARADTAWGAAEAQNEAFRAGAFGNPRPPIGMDNNRGYSYSTPGVPQGRPPGVPHQGGQQQPAPAATVQPIPIAQLNDATLDLKARTDLSLKDRVTAILGAKEVTSVDGRVLQGSERAAAVLNELNGHVRSAEVKNYATPDAKNAAIAAARGEVKAELDRVMADPSLRHNFSAFVAEGIKTPQDKENLQTALNNFTAVSGTENAAALQRHMQNLASPSTGRGAATAPAVNPQLQAARQQRDAAAAAIEIKAPDGAPQDRNTRAAQLNAAYKESLTPPAEGFAGVIQTIVKMIGHAIDQNNPRHMDSHQILALAEREGLRVEGKDNLERANRAVAAARGQTAPAPAAAAPAPAVAEASAAATAPAAPAAAPAPPAPAVAEAPAAPAAAAAPAAPAASATAPSANVLGERVAQLVDKYNTKTQEPLVLDNDGLHIPKAGPAASLARFDKDKDGKISSKERNEDKREELQTALLNLNEIGNLRPPVTPNLGNNDTERTVG